MELDDFIGDKTVSCHKKAKDRYRRIVAVCSAKGEDLGAWLVENGWALAYARYSKAYLPAETRARAAKAGYGEGGWKSRGYGGRVSEKSDDTFPLPALHVSPYKGRMEEKPEDYALRRMLEGIEQDDVKEAAFWLGVLAAEDEPRPLNDKVH